MRVLSHRRLAPLAAVGVLALLPSAAGAVAAPASARGTDTTVRAAAPAGPNPWLTEPVSATGLDYPGWATRIRALGRDRVASPQYAAARTTAGLDAPPLMTTAADLPSVLDQVGSGPGQRARLRVTSLPSLDFSFSVPVSSASFAVAAVTGPGSIFLGGGDGSSTGNVAEGVNLSGLFPVDSPVLGTGTTNVVVYDQLRGMPELHVRGATSATRLDLEFYPYGAQATGHRSQTLVLDVDGATLDTTPYGGSGQRTLSPLSTFLPKWGIKPGQEKALVNATAKVVREQLTARGATVTVVSTLSGADPYGAQDVSRVVLGGTRAQSGVDAISASAHVDPGNLDHEETSLVQLDALSAPPTDGLGKDDPSLNAWMDSSSDRVAFVSRALANLVLHEVGHTIGLVDTDDTDGNKAVMDSGGHQLVGNLAPLGVDRIGGTADDPVLDEPLLLGPAGLHQLQGLFGGYEFYDRVRDQAYFVKAA